MGNMARIVATKAALSIRIDALFGSDSKSCVDAASIGIENWSKLESRLPALTVEIFIMHTPVNAQNLCII